MNIKSGFLSSEFWINVLGGGIVAGTAAFGHPLDLSSVIGILGFAWFYTILRLHFKYTALQAWKEALAQYPNLSQDIKNILPIVEKPILNAIETKSVIAAEIIKEGINHEVNKL